MSQFTLTRTIQAPVALVFRTVSDIDNFSKAIPGIVSAEILSEIKSGVGTRFRETRLFNGREATTELTVTELVENERIRLVADTHGTVWDSLFTVRSTGDDTELTLTMEGRAYSLMAKLMNPMVKAMIGKALEQDMDAVKTYCERPHS